MTKPILRSWLDEHGGVITTREATAVGLTSADLQSAERGDILSRVCRGGYVDAEPVAEADPETRHRLRLAAVLRTRPEDLIATHTSAALVWGLPVSYQHLDRVHVARSAARGTTRKHEHHTLHEGYPAEASTRADGIPVVIAALAVLGTAFLCGVTAGVVAADAALRLQVTTMTELDRWMHELERTPGMVSARRAVGQASPTAESPGESRCRLILIQLGFSVVPQFTIRDPHGRFIGRVDFFLPDLGVVVEFDGDSKYAVAAGGGAQALIAEKGRENAIRRLGYGIVRVTWKDLQDPQTIAGWIWDQAATASMRTSA